MAQSRGNINATHAGYLFFLPRRLPSSYPVAADFSAATAGVTGSHRVGFNEQLYQSSSGPGLPCMPTNTRSSLSAAGLAREAGKTNTP